MKKKESEREECESGGRYKSRIGMIEEVRGHSNNT